MVDRLSRRISGVNRSLKDFESLRENFTNQKFFLLENEVYVLRDDFVHPGGNFLIHRLDQANITRYYFGVSPLETLPYPKLIYNHYNTIISPDYYQARLKMPESSLFVPKNINLVKAPISWKDDYSWRVWKLLLISKNHVMMFVKPKNVTIDPDEITKAIGNFGKICMIRFRYSNEFKFSYLQLSQIPLFIAKRRSLYTKLLRMFSGNLNSVSREKNDEVIIHFSKSRRIDFVQYDIHNKFIKKYLSAQELSPEEYASESEYINYLPVIIKLKDKRKFFDTLSKQETDLLKMRFLNKMYEPLEIAEKIKLALGGPFGFENILSNAREIFIYIDDDGVFAMQDFSYGLLRLLLTQLEENPSFVPPFSLNILYKAKVQRLTVFNEFLMSFYFFEKLTNSGLLKSLFVYTTEAAFNKFVAENEYIIGNGEQHIISAKYVNANYIYNCIKHMVPKNKLMFI